MEQDAQAEPQRRADAPASVAGVERAARGDSDHPHAGDVGNLTGGPLAAGEVGDVVAGADEPDDGSGALAEAAGARVVEEPRRGYGSAYLAGFAAAQGEYVVMADADLTYDFGYIPKFVAELEAGGELVIGDRMGNIQPGAMPWL